MRIGTSLKRTRFVTCFTFSFSPRVYSPECVEGGLSEVRARLDPETTLFNDARGSAG